jgi:ABC-type ATPase with predicted acetyltransferase domain
VARWFGVEPGDDPYAHGEGEVGEAGIDLRAGRIVLITGASGAGKSTLLRKLRARWRRKANWIDLAAIDPGEGLVVDVMTECLPVSAFADEDARVIAALEALSRVGLGEVWTYLRKPSELSEGQRWRLRLAMGIAPGTPRASWPRRLNGAPARMSILAADEFCAPLDRVTAMVVARALRRCIDANARGPCAVVATSHDDLAAALAPDQIVRCDFGAIERVR